MVAQLACNPTLSETIMAFAAAPLALYEGTQGTMGKECLGRKKKDGERGLPVLEIHGGRDKRVLYEGGSSKERGGLRTVGVPAWLQGWAGRDGYEVGNRTEGFEGVKGVNMTTWKCPVSAEKEEEGLVAGILSERMGHVWPTLENSGVDGSRVILEFFERWGGKYKGEVVVEDERRR